MVARLQGGAHMRKQYHRRNKMAQNSPVFASVLKVLDQEGIEYSIQKRSRRVILRESPYDYCGVTSFPHDASVEAQKVLSNRRAELASVAGVLRGKGAVLKSKQEVRGLTVDEVYHFVIEGEEIFLVLRS